jgi:tripartite-type tricarboxylate transporter receptor subunit TctC
MIPKIRTAAALLLAALVPSVALAQASAYPDRPIKFIVPVAAGGTTDVIARVIGARLTAAWGQPVVVDNRAGGSGIPATTEAIRAKPDGYTLFMGTIGTLTVNQSMFPNLGYDPLKDFTPVTLVAAAPTMLVVNPDLPVKTVKELIAYAKANPGKLNFPSPGNGTSPHLAGELFKSLAGIDATHVPYKGAAPALTDLIAGRVHFMFDNIITSLPHVKDGRLRALAVTSSARSKLVPELPTMAEAGLPGQEISGWVGIVAPAGTPPDIVNKLQAEIAKQLKEPGVADKIVGADAVGNTPEQFGAFLRSEAGKWSKLVKEANIRAD